MIISFFIGFPFPLGFWNFKPFPGLPHFILIDEIRKERIPELWVNFGAGGGRLQRQDAKLSPAPPWCSGLSVLVPDPSERL